MSLDRTIVEADAIYWILWYIEVYNGGKTIINYPFGNGLYHLGIVVKLGVVYYCLPTLVDIYVYIYIYIYIFIGYVVAPSLPIRLSPAPLESGWIRMDILWMDKILHQLVTDVNNGITHVGKCETLGK